MLVTRSKHNIHGGGLPQKCGRTVIQTEMLVFGAIGGLIWGFATVALRCDELMT